MTLLFRLAPQRIERDSYRGRWTRRLDPSAERVDSLTAAELTALDLPTQPGGELVVWESVGELDGAELFCRNRYVAQTNGFLIGYDSDGRRITSSSPERQLRILVS